MVAILRGGNEVGRVNEVTPRRVRLVLGWVTVSRRCLTNNPGKLGSLPSAGSELHSGKSAVMLCSWRALQRQDFSCHNVDKCVGKDRGHGLFTGGNFTGGLKKVAHTRLPTVGFRSWSRFLAVSLQATWVTNPAVGWPGLQLPSQPWRGLLPVSLLGEQRHDGCEQFA